MNPTYSHAPGTAYRTAIATADRVWPWRARVEPPDSERPTTAQLLGGGHQ